MIVQLHRLIDLRHYLVRSWYILMMDVMDGGSAYNYYFGKMLLNHKAYFQICWAVRSHHFPQSNCLLIG